MSIIRAPRPTQYTVIPNAVLEAKVPPDVLGVWVHILGKPDNWAINYAYLRKHFGMGSGRVKKVLDALGELGAVEKHEFRDPKSGKFTTDWVVHDHITTGTRNGSRGDRDEQPETRNESRTETRLPRPETSSITNTDLTITEKEGGDNTSPVESQPVTDQATPHPSENNTDQDGRLGPPEELFSFAFAGFDPVVLADWLRLRAKQGLPNDTTAMHSIGLMLEGDPLNVRELAIGNAYAAGSPHMYPRFLELAREQCAAMRNTGEHKATQIANAEFERSIAEREATRDDPAAQAAAKVARASFAKMGLHR